MTSIPLISARLKNKWYEQGRDCVFPNDRSYHRVMFFCKDSFFVYSFQNLKVRTDHALICSYFYPTTKNPTCAIVQAGFFAISTIHCLTIFY